MNKTYSLDFLAWCNRCLFRDDFLDELKELGAEFHVIYAFKTSEIWRKHCCVLGLYQNFMNHAECLAALNKWVEMMKNKWNKIKVAKRA